jgi:hypothetical protein
MIERTKPNEAMSQFDSPNASRLAAMQRADKNIGELLLEEEPATPPIESGCIERGLPAQ